jgi:hypothetical protein
MFEEIEVHNLIADFSLHRARMVLRSTYGLHSIGNLIPRNTVRYARSRPDDNSQLVLTFQGRQE